MARYLSCPLCKTAYPLGVLGIEKLKKGMDITVNCKVCQHDFNIRITTTLGIKRVNAQPRLRRHIE